MTDKATMLLDRFMPTFHFNEVHSTMVRASPEIAFRAIKEVTPAEIPLLRPLFTLRGLLAGRRHNLMDRFLAGQPALEQALNGGFVLLAEEPGREIVLGVIGRFWQRSGGIYRVRDADEFLAFDCPGYAKSAINFHLSGKRGAVRVKTETRIHVPDLAARRKFRAYWLVIRPGSTLLRISWLSAIKRRAEGTREV